MSRTSAKLLVDCVFCITLGVLSWPGPAHAAEANSDATRARELFRTGKEKFDSNQREAGCQDFLKSLELATSYGPLFAVAICEAEVHQKWVSALAAFKRAKSYARTPEELRHADERISELELEIPQLTVAVSSNEKSPITIIVETQGREVAQGQPGEPIKLDPGEYQVSAIVAGRRGATTPVKLKEGQRSQVGVDVIPAPARVTIVVSNAGSDKVAIEIRKDEQTVQTVSAGTSVSINPGRYELVAIGSNGQRDSRIVDLASGSNPEIAMSLNPAAAVAPAPSKRSQAFLYLGVLLSTGGVICAAESIYNGVEVNSAIDAMNAPTTGGLRFNQLRQDAIDHRQNALVFGAAGVAGLGLGVTSLLYYMKAFPFSGDSKRDSAPGAGASLVLTGNGIYAAGAF